MSQSSAVQSGTNCILAALPFDEMQILKPELHKVRLTYGQELQSAEQEIRDVYFLETGYAVVVAQDAKRSSQLALAIQGHETVTNVEIALGEHRAAFNSTVVEQEGRGVRINAGAILKALPHTPVLRRLLLDQVAAALVQLSITAACNALHPLPSRLARWLLEIHDRSDGDLIYTTQDTLAQALGVRRPSVTMSFKDMRENGAIAVSRGWLTVLDRGKLESASCGCYNRTKYAGRSVA